MGTVSTSTALTMGGLGPIACENFLSRPWTPRANSLDEVQKRPGAAHRRRTRGLQRVHAREDTTSHGRGLRSDGSSAERDRPVGSRLGVACGDGRFLTLGDDRRDAPGASYSFRHLVTRWLWRVAFWFGSATPAPAPDAKGTCNRPSGSAKAPKNWQGLRTEKTSAVQSGHPRIHRERPQWQNPIMRSRSVSAIWQRKPRKRKSASARPARRTIRQVRTARNRLRHRRKPMERQRRDIAGDRLLSRNRPVAQ